MLTPLKSRCPMKTKKYHIFQEITYLIKTYHHLSHISPMIPYYPTFCQLDPIDQFEPPRSPSCFARWGEFASGEAGRFDKDDLVQAVYPGSQEVYCAQVVWGGPVGVFFLGNKCYPKKRGWGLLGIMMQLGNAIFGYDTVIIVISVSWFRVTG